MTDGRGKGIVTGTWISDSAEEVEHPTIPIGINEMTIPRAAILLSLATAALLIGSTIVVGYSVWDFHKKNEDAFKVTDIDAINAENAAKDFFDYAQDLLDRRRINPEDDMITRLSQVSENDIRLTDHQIICTIILPLYLPHLLVLLSIPIVSKLFSIALNKNIELDLPETFTL